MWDEPSTAQRPRWAVLRPGRQRRSDLARRLWQWSYLPCQWCIYTVAHRLDRPGRRRASRCWPTLFGIGLAHHEGRGAGDRAVDQDLAA